MQPTFLAQLRSRRAFLRAGLWSASAIGAPAWLSACGGSNGGDDADTVEPDESPFINLGPLQAPDANGLRLPVGFTSRVVAVSGSLPAPTASLYAWHMYPDGGATFATDDGGWIYVSNSEVPNLLLTSGGVGALRFDASGNVVNAFSVLRGTSTNCAGGKTPWQTWLSCEEVTSGRVYECDPFAPGTGSAKPALGLFKHEAVAVDPVFKHLYLTEDESDGRLYRFIPSATDWPAGRARPDLLQGQLQVLRYSALPAGDVPTSFNVAIDQPVQWELVSQANRPQSEVRAELGSNAPGSRFKGGEGLWYFDGTVYFSTKGDERIWAYDTQRQTLKTIYDFNTASAENRVLSGVDNLILSEFGDVLVAEDGGDMQVCVITPDGRTLPLLQASDNQAGTELKSEITGLAFSPDGRRLYFSAQRNGRNGAFGSGITFELTLPFSACPTRTCS